MIFRRLTLALAVFGMAANLYMKTRRSQPSAAGPKPDGSGAAANPTNTATGLPGVGIDSPNTAERLEASHFAGTSAGIGAALGDGTRNEDLLAASPKNDSDVVAPGLPNFFRGA